MRAVIALCLSLACFAPTPAASGISPMIAAPPPSKWAGILKKLSYVESRNTDSACSWVGSRHGRGRYQVSEIVRKHVIERHSEWRRYTPDDLHDPRICAMFAVDQLEWLSRCYADKPDPLPWVLSAYWQGVYETEQKGVQWGYVQAVLHAPEVD